MNPEARGYIPPPTPKEQELPAPAPVWFAAERLPPLRERDLDAYRAWVEEVKAIYAKIGAKNSQDFLRIMEEHPQALSSQDLQMVKHLMDRVLFAWQHGHLMPEKHETPQGDWECPLGENSLAPNPVVIEKGSAGFTLINENTRDWNDGRRLVFVVSTAEQGIPHLFRDIRDLCIIGGLPCYVGERMDKNFSVMVGSREVSPLPQMAAEDIFRGEKRLHAIIDVQGVPAWFERKSNGIFFSLNGTHVGDPDGYHEIQEFCAYEGKLLFQARKGKLWHTVFDGKEIHPPTKDRRTYKHFGLCEGELLFTQTSVTDFFVARRQTTQVFCGERLVQEIKGISWGEVEVEHVGEGHVVTIAEYKDGNNDRPPYPHAIWMDGHRIISQGNEKTTFINLHRLSLVGNALAFMAWSREQDCRSFFIDGVNPDFSGYAIENYVLVGGEIYLVGWKKDQMAIFQGLSGKKLWETKDGDHRRMPKIFKVFGKLFSQTFEHGRWCVRLGTRELSTDQEAFALGEPVVLGDSHIVYWSQGKDGVFKIVDEEGNLYGAFSIAPTIEPVDAHSFFAYGREGKEGKDAKLVRRLIEL